jgi:hypothetical protein
VRTHWLQLPFGPGKSLPGPKASLGLGGTGTRSRKRFLLSEVFFVQDRLNETVELWEKKLKASAEKGVRGPKHNTLEAKTFVSVYLIEIKPSLQAGA